MRTRAIPEQIADAAARHFEDGDNTWDIVHNAAIEVLAAAPASAPAPDVARVTALIEGLRREHDKNCLSLPVPAGCISMKHMYVTTEDAHTGEYIYTPRTEWSCDCPADEHNARVQAALDEVRRPGAAQPAGAVEARGPVAQTACDRCTLGVMDANNPHLCGACDCECHQ